VLWKPLIRMFFPVPSGQVQHKRAPLQQHALAPAFPSLSSGRTENLVASAVSTPGVYHLTSSNTRGHREDTESNTPRAGRIKFGARLMLEFDDQYPDFAWSKVLHRVGRQRWHPLHTRNRRRVVSGAAIKRNLPVLIPPNEMTPTLHISNSAPAMCMQRHDVSRGNHCAKHSHTLIFEQDRVVLRRSSDRVEKLRPRPVGLWFKIL
jgi:hypothetical protein